MKMISKWACQHPLNARILIGISFFMLAIVCSAIAILLYDLSIELPIALAYLSLVTYLGLLVMLPVIRARFHVKDNYTSRLFFNSLGVLSFVVIAVVAVNQMMHLDVHHELTGNHTELNSNSHSFAQLVVLQAKRNSPKNLEDLKSSKFKWRIKSKIVKTIKKKLKKLKANQKKENIALTQFFLSLLLAGLLTLGIIGLGSLICHLSCSGYAVWTAVAAIGGIAALAVGLFFGIRWIVKWGKKQKEGQEKSTEISLGF